MATAEKRVVTDATGQAMLAELRKIPGVMNPLPIEKGGTGAATPEGAREAIGAQEKLGFNISEELNKRIKSVNKTLPDENGNVQIVRVPMADNFTSDESHVVSGTFIERTTGGDSSITDGNAYLGVLYGNSVRTGYTAETKNLETVLVERIDDSQPMTAEINWDTFRAAVSGISTNKTFSYTSVWNENPETYGITVGGSPKNGDVINVYFIAENRGTITNATPETFNSANWNLYDNETGYAKVLKYSDVYGFKIGGTYTGVSFSETVDGEKTVITPDSNGLFTIPSDGYVFVTGGNGTDTYVLMTWSDWENGYAGDFLAKSVSTIDFSEVMQNVFPFGLCAIGIVTDEINFNDRVATIRIERVAYSTENRIVAENSGRAFIYDANWIYSVKATPETVRFNVDNDLIVYDHGVEYFTGTEVPLTAFQLFGQNLKDKLRREVVAVTPQNFSAAQKQIARENIEAAWNSEVIKSINNKVPDANGNITIVEGQSNASYGSYRIDPVIPPAAWSLVNGQYQVAYSDPLIKSTMTGSETWLDNNDAMLGKTTFNTIDGALLIVTAVQPTETWRLHVLLAENGATVLEEVNNKAEESTVAIVETGDTAFHTISAGQYVMWNGALYKATVAIASGATLSATGNNANLSAVTGGVANELNAALQAQVTTLNSNKADKSSAITSITRNGTTFTATRADGTTFTFTQQDNNTTYSQISRGSSAGLAPGLPSGSGTTKYLREDGTWQVPPDNNTTYSKISRGSSAGLAPGLPSGSGTTKYLREDGTWQVPPDNNTTYSAASGGGLSLSGTAFSLANSGATAGSYGPSANVTPGYGSTFNVPYITVDAKGRVTAASTKTVKIPASDNTWRGIQNNLTSTSTTDSLSAAQGKALNDKITVNSTSASAASGSGAFTCYKINNLVFVWAYFYTGSATTYATIPSEYRPSSQKILPITALDTTSSMVSNLGINSNGAVVQVFNPKPQANTWYTGVIFYNV